MLIEIFESYGEVEVDQDHTQEYEKRGKHRGIVVEPAIEEI